MMIYRHQWKEHIAVYNNSDRGFCKLTIFAERGLRIACLHDLVVYPKIRGAGFGREMLLWAIGKAVQENCNALILWVDGEPWVADWYRRYGFQESEHFKNEDGEPCLMRNLNTI